MPGRQVWFFRFGCWTTVAAAVLVLAFHVAGRIVPVGAVIHAGSDFASTSFAVPGRGVRTAGDFLDGLSLGVAILIAAVGAIGLIVARRGRDDVLLMSRVARACAVTSVVLLVISLTKFSVVQAFVVAVMATCFLVASVEAPQPED